MVIELSANGVPSQPRQSQLNPKDFLRDVVASSPVCHAMSLVIFDIYHISGSRVP